MKHLFIVGAQRSGTSYLYNVLNEHPEIAMASPIRPEPKFFLDESLYSKGRTYYENRYFGKHADNTKFFGEKSTSYIESISAAKQIHSLYPDACILMILRNPVLRAWSNYRFSVQNNLETLNFDDALAAEPERLKKLDFITSVNPYAYRLRGHYINYINNYLKIFSHQQLHILIFEEIVGNLTEVQKLYQWLNIDSNFIPQSLRTTFNTTYQIDSIPVSTFQNLTFGYNDSLTSLEKHLGRQLQVWRDHWGSL